MRDGLTALAACVILLLGAALVVPPLMDWRGWRVQIDSRLGEALGMDITSEGDVSLALLPHPRLSLGQVRFGAGSGSHATVARLDLALSLPALMKGEARILSSAADMVLLVLRHDSEGRLILPASAINGSLADVALDDVSLSRMSIRFQPETGGEPVIIGPIAASLSAPGLAGPWRVDAELAGEPVRLVTGVAEPGKGIPLKLASLTSERRIEIEGHVKLAQQAQRLAASWTGQATVALKTGVPATGEGKPVAAEAGTAATLTLQGSYADGRLDAAALTIEMGGAGQLEGKGTWAVMAGEAAQIQLTGRRLNVDAIPAALDGIRSAGFLRPGGKPVNALEAMKMEVALSAEQAGWKGEEITGISARISSGPGGMTLTDGAAQFAGMALTLAGKTRPFANIPGVNATVTARAASMQRLALAAARMGMRPDAADALSRLGEVELSFAGGWEKDGFSLSGLDIATSLGKLSGTITKAADSLDVKLNASGFDLLGAAALAPLWPTASMPHSIQMDLSARDVRFGTGVPGSARLVASRQGGEFKVLDFEATGFGGLAVKALPPDAGGRIEAMVSAPDAAAVLALAAFAIPDGTSGTMARHALGNKAPILSPMELRVTLDPRMAMPQWRAEGSAGVAQTLRIDGELAAGVPELRHLVLEGVTGNLLRLLGPVVPEWMALLPNALPARSELGLAVPPGRDSPWAVHLRGMAPPGRGMLATWQPVLPRGEGDTAVSGPFSLTQDGTTPFSATASLGFGADGFAIRGLDLSSGPLRLKGNVHQARNLGGIEGHLTAEGVSVAQVASLALGAVPADAAGDWPSQRFGQVRLLPRARIGLTTDRLVFQDITATAWTSDVVVDESTLRLENISARVAGGMLGGSVRLGHEGSLRSLGWRLRLTQADLAAMTAGRVTGQATLSLDGGASAETPLRLVSTLGGAGQARLTGASITRLSPAALGQLVAEGDAKGSGADLLRGFQMALQQADWPLGDVAVPLNLLGGVLRSGTVTSAQSGAGLDVTGILSLRSGHAEVLARMVPSGKTSPGEQRAEVKLAWRGVPPALQPEIDINGVRNLIATRELQREIDRIDAFQADLRERGFFARRLRQEREAKERELREQEVIQRELRERVPRASQDKAREDKAREDRAREDKAREEGRQEAARIMGRRSPQEPPSTAPQTPTSGPMQILPVPLPMPLPLPPSRAPAP